METWTSIEFLVTYIIYHKKIHYVESYYSAKWTNFLGSEDNNSTAIIKMENFKTH